MDTKDFLNIINMVFIAITSIILANLNNKLDVQKNRQNKLKELEIDYAIEFWEKTVKLDQDLFHFLAIYRNPEHIISVKEREILLKRIEDLMYSFFSYNSYFSSIKFFLAESTVKIIEKSIDNLRDLFPNLLYLHNSEPNTDEYEKYYKLANKNYENFNEMNKEVYSCLKNSFYEKDKNFFERLFTKKS